MESGSGEKALPTALISEDSTTSWDEPPVDSRNRRTPRRQAHSWQPSIWKLRPWVGLIAIGISIMCLFVSLGVLLGSRGQPVESWYFQPTVYLAIATAVSNTALNVALAQAAPIRWWWKAYKGSTISDLELEWEAGQSFPRALLRGYRQGRHLNLLTLASIAVALVVVDGPLLQRSSSVTSSSVHRSIVQEMVISPELPTGFSGLLFPSGLQYLKGELYEIARQYGADKPIESTSTCEGSCAMTVHAPGISSQNCTTKRWHLNEYMLHSINSSWGSQYEGFMPSRPALFAKVFMYTPGTPLANGPGPEQALLIVGRLEVKNTTEGAYIETNCTLSSAIVEYDIVVKGREIAFTIPPSAARIIRPTENTFVDRSLNRSQPITWLGLVTYLQAYTSTNVSGGYSGPQDATSAYPYPDSSTMNELALRHAGRGSAEEGGFATGDPTTDILNIFGEVMFRAGVVAGGENETRGLDGGLTTSQSVKANQTLVVNVYSSDLRWFVGAAAIQFVAFMMTLPAFYGWWHIGVRDFVLSPFRVANIFNAPILDSVNSAAGVIEMLRETGDKYVQLGVVESAEIGPNIDSNHPEGTQPQHRKSRLAVDDTSRVSKPFKGMQFDV